MESARTTNGAASSGLTICMTGACPSLTRDSLWAASEKAGFTVKKNVSSLVDVLVAADPTSQSGKARKARQLGIEIEPYEWLVRSLGDRRQSTP